jgi:hypothetical protein
MTTTAPVLDGPASGGVPSGGIGSVGAGSGVGVADAHGKGSSPSSLFVKDTDALGKIVSRMFTTELQQLTDGINDVAAAAIASALRVVLTGETPSDEEAEVIRIIYEHIALAGSPAATLIFQAPIGAAHEVALPGAGLPAHTCNGLLMTCHQAILTAADTAPAILDTTIGQQLSAYAAYVQQATRIEEAKQSAQMTAISHLINTSINASRMTACMVACGSRVHGTAAWHAAAYRWPSWQPRRTDVAAQAWRSLLQADLHPCNSIHSTEVVRRGAS